MGGPGFSRPSRKLPLGSVGGEVHRPVCRALTQTAFPEFFAASARARGICIVMPASGGPQKGERVLVKHVPQHRIKLGVLVLQQFGDLKKYSARTARNSCSLV